MNLDKSKFITDNGIFLTNALFKEIDLNNLGLAVFTLAPDDIEENGRKYISLRRIYLEENDPTEYKIANKYFCSWAHWKKVRESSRIKAIVDELREELEVRMRSRGVAGVLDKAMDGDYQASKWFAERGWIPTGLKKRGAPSKEEVQRELKIASKVSSVIDLDYERLMKKT